MPDHDWPSERPGAYAPGLGERCSTCGVRRHGDDRAKGACPGPGADGTPFKQPAKEEEPDATQGG